MKSILAGLTAVMLFGQTSRPAFEVASVRLNTANGPMAFVPQRSGERVSWRNVQLGQVILFAWHLTNFQTQLAGDYRLPDGWNWYDIEAIAPAATSEDNLRLMFQKLLEERFQLRYHRETKEVPSWDLVIAKGGSKLTPTDPERKVGTDGKFFEPGKAAVAGFKDGPHLMGKAASMDQLASSVASTMGGPVFNRTGLTGLFDYNVLFARESDSAELTVAPPLNSAMQKELGLRLEPSKTSVEVLTIDRVEKPTPN